MIFFQLKVHQTDSNVQFNVLYDLPIKKKKNQVFISSVFILYCKRKS